MSAATEILPSRVIKPWHVVTLLVVWLAASVVGYSAYQRFATTAEPAPKGQITTVQRGTIAAAVITTGSVVATGTAKVSFNASGKLAALLVKVGDAVQQGQPLARLDTTDLQLQVAQAQSQLTSAQAKLDLMKQGSRPEDIAAAQASLASANASLVLLQAGPTDAATQAAQSSVASAKSGLVAAQGALATLQAQPLASAVQAAQLALEKAKDALWSTQLSRDGTCNGGHSAQYQCDSANVQVTSAENGVATATIALDKASQPATADALRAAQDAVTSSQMGYDNAVAKLAQVNAGATAADIAAAQASVAAARNGLALKNAPYTAADLQGAQASVDQAKASFQSAQNQLDNAVLAAPFAGTVASITMNPGEVIGASNNIVILNPNALRIDTTVAESDVTKLAVGQNATVTFDALTGQTFTGKVIAIAPTGTVQQGVVTYVVSVSLDSSAGVRPGMTANANLIYQQKDNILIVPSRAIIAQGRNRVVNVVTAAGNVATPVQIGISDGQSTEIVSGVQAGDQIMIPATTTTAPRVGGALGGGGFIAPAGGRIGG